jgi:hypothetical protein
MAILMENPPLTASQRLAVRREVVAMSARIALIKNSIRGSHDADLSNVEHTLRELASRYELSPNRSVTKATSSCSACP